MSETIITGYKRLFELRLLHHYWLDEASTVFEGLSQAERDKRLLLYDRRPFLRVVPTATTQQVLNGLRAVYKDTALGAVVAIGANQAVPDDTVLEFVVTVQALTFHHYTLHSLKPRDIESFLNPLDQKTYRYKRNVFVWSNVTGSQSGTDTFLSRPYPLFTLPATDYPAEALLATNANRLLEVTNETGTTMQPYNNVALDKLPIFVHQDDVPGIVPPAGLTGVPTHGLLLTHEYPDDIYGLIRIRAKHPSDAAFDCTSGGVAKTTPPVFQLRFKNRVSVWRYKNKNNPGATGTDDGAFPMTYSGNPHTKPKALTTHIKLDLVQVGPDKKIDNIVSEIFI